MNNRLILGLMLLFLTASAEYSFAVENTSKIDSLHMLLNNSKNEQRVDLLIALSEEYINTDLDVSAHMSKVASDLSKELNYNEGGGKSFLYLGNYYRNKVALDSAIIAYKKSLKFYENLNKESRVSELLNLVGLTYMESGDFSKALDYLVKALLIIEERGVKKGISQSYLNIGVVMQKLHEYPQAEEYYNKALALLSKEDNDVKELKGEILMKFGELKFELKNYSEAEDYYQQALINIKQSKNIAKEVRLYVNMADLYYVKSDVNNAISFYQSSLNLNKLNTKDVKLEAEVKIKMGNCYASRAANLNKGLKLIEDGIKIAEKISYNEGVQIGYQCKAEAYYANKKYKEAYEFEEKYVDLHVSLVDDYLDIEVQKFQALLQLERLRVDQKTNEIEQLNEVIRVSKKNNYIIYSVALLVIVGLIVKVTRKQG